MGFGPKAPDVESGVAHVRELIDMLYPEHATPRALDILSQLTRILLTARVPLSFAHIHRLLQDDTWRHWVEERLPEPLPAPWTHEQGPIDPTRLDPDFGWLLADRLEAARQLDEIDEPEPEDE